MKPLRPWPWGPLATYNGFFQAERVRGWQVITFMIDNGIMRRASVCSISGQTDRVQYHSENYLDPAPHAINQVLHMALHQRFRKPEAWKRIVDRYAKTGGEWFAILPLEPTDLASQARAQHGSSFERLYALAQAGDLGAFMAHLRPKAEQRIGDVYQQKGRPDAL